MPCYLGSLAQRAADVKLQVGYTEGRKNGNLPLRSAPCPMSQVQSNPSSIPISCASAHYCVKPTICCYHQDTAWHLGFHTNDSKDTVKRSVLHRHNRAVSKKGIFCGQ